MSQAFSEAALRKLEDHVLIHVKTFVERLSAGGANGEKVTDVKEGSWTPSTNLARMCKLLLEGSTSFRFRAPKGLLF